jgi:PAS domain S-box-containing protein
MNDQSIKVLLVEDEPLASEWVKENLAKAASARFQLSHVTCLDAAKQQLRASPFDVVLLDLSLPDSQGLVTCTEVQTVTPALPIIILTAADNESLALQAVREGAQDYLVKGEFDGKLLARVIRYAIERKRAEQKLRQSEEFFRLITENVTDLIAVLDQNGNRLYNSPSYKNSLGRATGLEGTNSFKEIHPEDKERIKQMFQETIAGGVGHRTEYRMLLEDGTVRHIESQGSVVKDAAGKPSKVVVVSRDITERKEAMVTLEQTLAELRTAHVALKATQMQLVQSEKLEAVSTFAGGIAHEVKNPLQTIMLGVDFLKTALGSTDESTTMVLNEMEQAAHRADGVIKGLVEFSAYKKRDVRDHDLSSILEQALQSVENELSGHAIKLVRELTPGLPAIRLDLKTVKHVFMNLMLSAIQAMSSGGTLTVKTYLKQLADNQGWSGRTPGQLKSGDTIVVAEVEDNGRGVIESKLADKSNRSYATEMIRKGVVDLMVLKKVVELYGGMIQIINRDEGGVRVVIMFKVQRKE